MKDSETFKVISVNNVLNKLQISFMNCSESAIFKN